MSDSQSNPWCSTTGRRPLSSNSARASAYQWRKISTNVVFGSSSGETRRTKHGTEYEVTETPGYVERQECFYTFYARSSGGRWFITNFRKPKLECE